MLKRRLFYLLQMQSSRQNHFLNKYHLNQLSCGKSIFPSNSEISPTCFNSLAHWIIFAKQTFSNAEIGGNDFRVLWAIHTDQRPPLIAGCPEPLERLMTHSWHKVGSLFNTRFAGTGRSRWFLGGAGAGKMGPAPHNTKKWGVLSHWSV